MNRGQLRSLLETRIGDKTNRWTPDQKNLELNIAYQRALDYAFFALKKPWPFLEASTTLSFTAGNGTIAKPTDVKQIKGIWLGANFYDAINTNKLGYVATKDREQYFGGRSTGTPTNYFLYGSSIILFPVPQLSGTIYVEYIKSVANMTDDAHSPVEGFPEEYHDIIVLGATEQLKDSNGGSDLNEGKNAQTKFNTRLQVMAEVLISRELDRAGFVRDTEYYDSDGVGIL